LCKSCRTCLKFYCMFYFTCDRSFRQSTKLADKKKPANDRFCLPMKSTDKKSECKASPWCFLMTSRINDVMPIGLLCVSARIGSLHDVDFLRNRWSVLRIRNAEFSVIWGVHYGLQAANGLVSQNAVSCQLNTSAARLPRPEKPITASESLFLMSDIGRCERSQFSPVMRRTNHWRPIASFSSSSSLCFFLLFNVSAPSAS